MQPEPTTSPELPDPSDPVHRRRALGLLGAGLVAIVGCARTASGSAGSATTTTTAAAGAGSSSTSTTSRGTSTTADTTACSTIPEETAGPYPGDGSNGPNVLTQDGVVRRDIRTNLGSSTPLDGVPLTVELTLVDVANGCAPLAGAAVYIWHCDAEGQYSMYGQSASDTFLRGVQESDADGRVSFTSIFPGAYSGRWPHIHFEVFPSLAVATRGSNRTAVSQLALPEDICELVYATDGYDQSTRNLSRTSLDSDNVFRDGHALQLATVTGNGDDGFVAALTVGV